jgi:uncharacterized protein (TIGR02172 family)
MTESLGRPFAAGRTAEVYAWEGDRILKLYHAWCPDNWVDFEARVARSVQQAGIPAPAAGDIIEIDGRRGILYQRVDGPSMLAAINKNPFKLPAYAAMLASLHLEMHRAAAPDLLSQREGMQRSIQSAKALPEDLRRRALQALESLPDGERLCHGDFHPGNVILTSQGPAIIDWMTATRGHPAADVARTRLLLTLGQPPNGGLANFFILLGRRLYYRTYLKRYAESAPQVVWQSEAFLPVMAAARLNEDIANERAALLKIVGILS